MGFLTFYMQSNQKSNYKDNNQKQYFLSYKIKP